MGKGKNVCYFTLYCVWRKLFQQAEAAGIKNFQPSAGMFRDPLAPAIPDGVFLTLKRLIDSGILSDDVIERGFWAAWDTSKFSQVRSFFFK
jgi:hypothetical protein